MNRGRVFPPYTKPYAGIPRPVSQVTGPFPPGSNIGKDVPPPFLPDLGGMSPYDPPVAALIAQDAPPTIGVAPDYEAQTIEMEWPVLLPNGSGTETTVYKSHRRWRSCDVYVENTAEAAGLSTTAILTIRVYALSQYGTRTVVASGRYRVGIVDAITGIPQQIFRREWIAAARATSEHYEITAVVTRPAAAAGPIAGQLRVTMAFTDEMTEPHRPHDVGCIESAAGSEVRWALVGLAEPPELELLGVWGVNTTAFPRFMMVFDTRSTVPIVGGFPSYVFPLGSAPGEGFSTFDLAFRTIASPRLIVTSNVVAPLVQVFDCLVGELVR